LTAQPGAESAGQQPSQAVNSENEQVVVAGKSILPQLPASAGAQQQQTPPDTQSDNQAGQQRLGRQVRDYAAQQPATPAASQTADPRRENAVRQPELAKVELAREQQNPALARQSPQSDTGSSTQPYEPEIINYWQVPEKMREGLPDLRISVLVYAEAPENRFVLMNGERLREGQELPNGLLLEEILRDRAIFNYRNYRFYLKS
jgi:general secretion pathway protein B